MQNKLFLKAADICELLEVKQTSAYEIIGNLNKELEEQGYLTLTIKLQCLNEQNSCNTKYCNVLQREP